MKTKLVIFNTWHISQQLVDVELGNETGTWITVYYQRADSWGMEDEQMKESKEWLQDVHILLKWITQYLLPWEIFQMGNQTIYFFVFLCQL